MQAARQSSPSPWLLPAPSFTPPPLSTQFPLSPSHVPSLLRSFQAVELGCGLVQLTPSSGPGTYYVYFLPYYQTGGGAWVHFHWFNCTTQGPECVLSPVPSADAAGSVCTSALSTPGVTVTGLETRASLPTVDRPECAFLNKGREREREKY